VIFLTSLDEIKESMQPKEVMVEWEVEGEKKEIPFKLKPMSYGEVILLAKKGEKEGKDRFSLQYDLLTSMVKKKTDDGDWARISKKDLQELPQGFVVKLSDKVNDFLGLGEELENFQNSLNTMR
jgi:hypothetical protein